MLSRQSRSQSPSRAAPAPSGGPVLIVADASAELADRDAILAPLVAATRAVSDDVRVVTASELVRHGYFEANGSPLPRAAALVLGGGDPFRLLSALRAAALLEPIRRAYQAGLPVVGQSAGALVSGPSLVPAQITSPFRPAPVADPGVDPGLNPGVDPDVDLAALRLESGVVLPHHDRHGRAGRHWQAAQRHGGRWPLQVLCDDEALIWARGVWRIVGPRGTLRLAVSADAPQLAAVFAAAAARAWSAFLPSAELAAASAAAKRAAAAHTFAEPTQAALWQTRLADPRWRTLVAEDPAGIVGFARYGPIPGLIAGPIASPIASQRPDVRAELDLLYVHPRAWGLGDGPSFGSDTGSSAGADARAHSASGARADAAFGARSVARRLLLRAHFDLAAAGHRRAWLWTEHRNTRALALYTRAGWVPDGSEDVRRYRGSPIRNIGLTVDLTQLLG
jgi:GNAT superfamily N-acetyltransferase